MKRRITMVAAVAAVLMTLTGCSDAAGGGQSGGAPISGGDFHVALGDQPSTLDPGATSSTGTLLVASNIFEGLVALDEDFKPQPVLAESVDVSPDFTKYSFNLRTDVVFHNGQPMTADDVVASAKRWISDSANGQQFFADAQVSSPSANVVDITNSTPLFTGLQLLADPQFAIMPASVVAQKGAAGVDEIVGTGPFKLGEWKKDQSIQLQKFADYKSPAGKSSGLAGEKKPVVDNLYFDIVPDASSRLAGLQTGQYQVTRDMTPDQFAQLQGDPSLTAATEPNGFSFLVFNKKQGLMSNKAMRQAIQSAIDVKEIAKAAYANDEFYQLDGGLSLPAQPTSYTTEGTDSYDNPDPEKAKEYLKQAGYNGETVRYLVARNGANEPYYRAAVVIQQELKAVGINVDLVTSDWATLAANRAKPDAWDLFATSWEVVPTPLVYGFMSPSWPGWTDDAAIETAKAAVNSSKNDDEALVHYGELQTAVYNYLPIAKFSNFSTLTGMQKAVGGYRSFAFLSPILYDVYKTQ